MLIISLIFTFALASLTSCSKKDEELPSIFKTASIGNEAADLFFKKDELKKLGLSGKIVGSVLVNNNPQIILLDLDEQKIRFLTKGSAWARTPEFSLDGKSIYFSAQGTQTAVIKSISLLSNKIATVSVNPVADLFSPTHLKGDRLVYSVFPKQGNFRLALYDLKKKSESDIKMIRDGIDYSIKAAESEYDPSSNKLFFVNTDNPNRDNSPINIWAFSLDKNEIEKLTSNDEVKVFEYKGNKILSPQIYDLHVSGFGKILYCVRYLEKHEGEESPHIVKVEAHILDLKTKEDRLIAVEATSIKSPIQVSKKHVILCYPEQRQLVLIDIEKPHKKITFLSLGDFIGDLDFYED
jgi:hypothetical protein